MRRSLLYLLVFFFIFTSSCKHNPLKIDVSGVKIEEVKIKRFEQDLFKLPFNSSRLTASYGDFFRGFVETAPFCPNGIQDPACQAGIIGFVNDPDMRAAYEGCEKEFSSTTDLETELNDAFRHFRYYFPSRPLPLVNTMMSGFNFNILKLDKTIGIGLEMYLGANSIFYKRIEFPKYKIIKMRKEYLLPDFVKGWMLTEFERKNAKPDFLTRIIEEGKIAYLVDALLPEVNDTLKLGFSQSQLDWCKRNEGHMWSFFIKRKILYSTDYQEIMQFTNDGPFTTGFAKESPSRTGNWIGLQIVRSYMEKNKNITIEQLMGIPDAQKILAASAYKPKL